MPFSRLRLPVIAAPMFLISGPDLVTEACRAGVIGGFPALNARTTEDFADWLARIDARLARTPEAAPYAVNLIVHRSNPRLSADLERIVAARVPIVITSLGAVPEVAAAVHSYGGLLFHDVTTVHHAEKVIRSGVDGIIAVARARGGHAGLLSPFALVAEIRAIFDGPIALAGAIGSGAQIAAARAMGADLAYMGTRFIATRESMASDAQKAMLIKCAAADLVYTDAVSGIPANFLGPSLRAAGLDIEAARKPGLLDVASEAKAWKTIWSAGHGTGGITDAPPVAELCARLVAEYTAARGAAARDPYPRS